MQVLVLQRFPTTFPRRSPGKRYDDVRAYFLNGITNNLHSSDLILLKKEKRVNELMKNYIIYAIDIQSSALFYVSAR